MMNLEQTPHDQPKESPEASDEDLSLNTTSGVSPNLTTATSPSLRPVCKKEERNEISVYSAVVGPYEKSVAVVVIRSGSDQDPAGKSGRAHFFEHLFGGAWTGHDGKRLLQFLGERGWTARLFTSQSRVMVGFECPPDDVAEAAKLITEILNTLIDGDEKTEALKNAFGEEKGRILVEIATEKSNLDRYAEQLIDSVFFRKSDRAPIPGTRDSVGKLTLKDVLGYRNDHLHKDNIFIVVTGHKEEFVREALDEFTKLNVPPSPDSQPSADAPPGPAASPVDAAPSEASSEQPSRSNSVAASTKTPIHIEGVFQGVRLEIIFEFPKTTELKDSFHQLILSNIVQKLLWPKIEAACRSHVYGSPLFRSSTNSRGHAVALLPATTEAGQIEALMPKVVSAIETFTLDESTVAKELTEWKQDLFGKLNREMNLGSAQLLHNAGLGKRRPQFEDLEKWVEELTVEHVNDMAQTFSKNMRKMLFTNEEEYGRLNDAFKGTLEVKSP